MNTGVEEQAVLEQAVFFRLAPEYRRIAIYLLVGGLLGVAILACMQHLGLARADLPDALIAMAILPGSLVAVALFILRQLLRVDGRGIWRRRFFRWDLWPWEAFAGQQIHQGTGRDSFIYPAKPWWNRYLLLEFLEEKDRAQLVDRIKGLWKPPPLPALPKELTIRWGLRSWAILSEEGIHIGKGKHDIGCFYRWWAVLRVRITRHDHARRDVWDLEFEFPGSTRPIALGRHKGRPLWRGAKPEVLAAFLERVVPADRLLITARTGSPQSFAEADWRLAELDRRERESKRGSWGFGLFFGTLLLGALICILFGVIFQFWDCFKIGVMILFEVTVFGPIFPFATWTIAREIRAERTELVAWRDAQSQ